VSEQVAKILDDHHFDLPLVMDEKHAFFDYQHYTLDEIVQRVQALLPQANWAEVQSAVSKAYAAKKQEAEAKKWQVVIQVLYTPQLTLWASQPSPLIQQNLQFSLGLNQQRHPYGRKGWEETVQLSGTFFNLGGEGLDWFQNSLLSYQLSYVAPLGHDFRLFGHHRLWANLQGSVFAQVAAGLGSSWDQGSDGQRRLNLGFLLQPSAGGQLTLNVSVVQIVIQGSLVYSVLSPTSQPGSVWTHSVGVQGGAGLGLQF
jgi:hypothetical protein